MRALLLPALLPGENLKTVALARDASTILRGLVSVLLPMAIVGAVMVALKVDARKQPIMTAIIGVSLMASAVIGLLIGYRKVRRYAVGLSETRLLVAPLADRSGLRAQETWTFLLADLVGLPVTVKAVNMGAGGQIRMVGQFRIPAPDHPLWIDLVPAYMDGNREAFYDLRSALVPSADPAREAADPATEHS